MVYKISNDCVMCGMCELECPVNAIYESGVKYEIDSDICVGCGTCSDICPISAPKIDPDII